MREPMAIDARKLCVIGGSECGDAEFEWYGAPVCAFHYTEMALMRLPKMHLSRRDSTDDIVEVNAAAPHSINRRTAAPDGVSSFGRNMSAVVAGALIWCCIGLNPCTHPVSQTDVQTTHDHGKGTP